MLADHHLIEGVKGRRDKATQISGETMKSTVKSS
jgi:hypothetical protein